MGELFGKQNYKNGVFIGEEALALPTVDASGDIVDRSMVMPNKDKLFDVCSAKYLIVLSSQVNDNAMQLGQAHAQRGDGRAALQAFEQVLAIDY